MVTRHDLQQGRLESQKDICSAINLAIIGRLIGGWNQSNVQAEVDTPRVKFKRARFVNPGLIWKDEYDSMWLRTTLMANEVGMTGPPTKL